MIYVGNLRVAPEPELAALSCTQFVVARPTVLGNPYVIGRDGSREVVIEKYRRWLFRKIESKDAAVMKKLDAIREAAGQGDVMLLCHCSPAACHADVIKRAVEWMMSCEGLH